MANNPSSYKNILITGAFRFPDKDAASQRVLGIGKAFREIGNNVIFCGWEAKERTQDIAPDGSYYYQDFQYFSMNELDLIPANKIEKLKNFLFKGSKTLKWIKENFNKFKFDSIIVYNSNSYFLNRLLKFCNKNKIKLIADCTEWYEGSHLPGGKYGLANFDNNYRIKNIYPKIKNIILISSYLENFYKQKGCRTIIVPPLVDLSEKKWDCSVDKLDTFPIKLIYAGDPGKKDHLNNLFLALRKLNENKIMFEFNIIGLTAEKVSSMYFQNNELPNYIHCLGRLRMEEIPCHYKKNHYSVLLRENKRYANAGFPTKFVESFVSGVPVIANITSDLDRYLINKNSGFVINNLDVDTLAESMRQIYSNHLELYETLKKNTFSIAIQSFGYKNYTKPLNEFL